MSGCQTALFHARVAVLPPIAAAKLGLGFDLAAQLRLASPRPFTLLAAIAREMTAETSAVSIALTRQMLWRFAGAPDPLEPLGIYKPMSVERGGHADVREGVQAFIEKRSPSFPGKVSQDMPSQYP
jgi:hypothetical protein